MSNHPMATLPILERRLRRSADDDQPDSSTLGFHAIFAA